MTDILSIAESWNFSALVFANKHGLNLASEDLEVEWFLEECVIRAEDVRTHGPIGVAGHEDRSHSRPHLRYLSGHGRTAVSRHHNVRY